MDGPFSLDKAKNIHLHFSRKIIYGSKVITEHFTTQFQTYRKQECKTFHRGACLSLSFAICHNLKSSVPFRNNLSLYFTICNNWSLSVTIDNNLSLHYICSNMLLSQSVNNCNNLSLFVTFCYFLEHSFTISNNL